VIEILRIVENALAGIACNDLIILADFLKNLRPDPNLTDFANFISRRSDTDAAAMFSDPIVPEKEVGRD
jgi:hypothetical protein